MIFFAKFLRKIIAQQIIIRSTITTINPVSLAYNVFEENSSTSNAPPLIIMHGLLGSKTNWRRVGKTLQSELIPRRKVFTVDSRNHGDSPHTNEHSYLHLAEDVAYFIKQHNLSTASVMGHSMGGRTMMCLALKYPTLVDRAIFVDISPIQIPTNLNPMIFQAMKKMQLPDNMTLPEGRIKAAEYIYDQVHSKTIANFVTMGLKKNANGGFQWSINVDAMINNANEISTFPEELKIKHFGKPVLFIAGLQSNFFSQEDWPEIQKIFPNSSLVWLDTGHIVHMDDPAGFIKTVANFLNN